MLTGLHPEDSGPTCFVSPRTCFFTCPQKPGTGANSFLSPTKILMNHHLQGRDLCPPPGSTHPHLPPELPAPPLGLLANSASPPLPSLSSWHSPVPPGTDSTQYSPGPQAPRPEKTTSRKLSGGRVTEVRHLQRNLQTPGYMSTQQMQPHSLWEVPPPSPGSEARV